MKRIQFLAALLALALLVPAASAEEGVQKIALSSTQQGEGYVHAATLNGQNVPEYDYTWHADPSADHDQVKNSPAEYYTGTEPSGEDAVYIAHDIVYYPLLDEDKFQRVNYDGEMEWVYMYEAEGYEDYIFSTLPVQMGGNGFPSQMMHSEEEAYQNAVLHITQPGTYELTGDWHGQIWIDLGDEDDVYADPSKKVTLILNGVNVNCTVAPGVVFRSVYECDNAWEDAESYSHIVDTADAGANVVLADGTVNNVSGTNIFRILRTKYKDDDPTEAFAPQKKQWKIDGAFYSYMSLNIDGQSAGTGVLNITAGFEGLDSEHHLTFNGGHVNIYSQDDGINVNEDDVSVLTVNGGSLHICGGLGSEGDGIDSNGYLVVNGGVVISSASPMADSGLDSDCGSFVNGGTVVALGSTMDWAEADEASSSTQPVLNLRFAGAQSSDEAIVITNAAGHVVFAYDPDKDEVTGQNQRSYSGAIISGPGLAIGDSYEIHIGGDVEGQEESGVYDPATITGFSGSTRQCYSGESLGGFGGRGGFGGGERPDGMGRDEKPDGMGKPEDRGDWQNMTPPDLPEGMEMPWDGMNPPEGMEMPEGFDPGQMGGFGGGFPGDFQQEETSGEVKNVFTLEKQVNAFSGVTDAP